MQKFDIDNFIINKIQHITLYKTVCPICGYRNVPEYLSNYCPICGKDLLVGELTELNNTKLIL